MPFYWFIGYSLRGRLKPRLEARAAACAGYQRLQRLVDDPNTMLNNIMPRRSCIPKFARAVNASLRRRLASEPELPEQEG